ncbi:hypothetical protein D3C77_523630 [compost metagenome]
MPILIIAPMGQLFITIVRNVYSQIPQMLEKFVHLLRILIERRKLLHNLFIS